MRPTMLPSEEDLRAQYEYLVEARECLVSLGFQVQLSPTVEAYLADGGTWLPHNEIESQVAGFEELEAAYAACPQLPARR